jgi:hypothetical protein
MFRFEAALVAAAFAASLGACVRPTTQVATPAPQPAHSEQFRQQQLVIESDLRQQQRVEEVGHALLIAASPFCPGARAPRAGVRFANVHSFAGEYQEAARSLGFTDTLVIVGVTRGSTAARSGLSLGDRLIAVNGGPPPLGQNAASLLARELVARPKDPPRVTLEQGPIRFLTDDGAGDDPGASAAAGVGGQLSVAIPADTVCGLSLVATRRDDLSAWADGANVTITSAMLRFVANDDELAALLAHEIAHNALRHVQAHGQMGAGVPSGVIVDIMFAPPTTPKTPTTHGVSSQGEPTTHGANVGSTAFTEDVELEADYIAMYVLARAGRPTAKAPGFWRRIARENPGGVKYATTHPTTVGRFVRLDEVSREIERKIASREELRPEPPAASPSPSTAVAQAPAKKPPAANRPAATTATVLVDRGRTSAALVVPKSESAPSQLSSAGEVGLISTTTIVRGDTVSYTFGPPVPRNGLTLAQVRRHAIEAYDDGREAFEMRLYQQAEDKFREAILYDGSDARYHAALGSILLKRGKRGEAEAVLSAAVLLDVEKAEYRQLLLEARKR